MTAKIGTTNHYIATADDYLARQRLEAFSLAYHNQLRELFATDRVFIDLAVSFPALLFALATGYGTARRRKATMKLVLQGEPLRECAAKLELPYWTRKLPPEAFTRPLGAIPSGQEDLDDTFASRPHAVQRNRESRMAQFIPVSHRATANWLNTITYATETCGEDFAIWVARHKHNLSTLTGKDAFPYLAAWAWFSKHPETDGYALLPTLWTPAIGPKRALGAISLWLRRIGLLERLGDGVEDTWIPEGHALGYDFVALRTIKDFLAESQIMDNCLDQYNCTLDGGNEDGISHIFSVRKNGRPIADLEIGTHPSEPSMPAIVQLRGVRNRRASTELWQAAYAWLGANPIKLCPSGNLTSRAKAKRSRAAKAFWQPYLDHLKGTPHRAAFNQIVQGRTSGKTTPQRQLTANRRRSTELAASRTA